ncbi:MAG: ABC transporter ATP-binding protein [Alphaproteobacteria bacterium]|nr:ABC transporter ATP-binding protein [Alphaproteobacteria bacterium]
MNKIFTKKYLILRILAILAPFRIRLIFAGISLISVVVAVLSIGALVRDFIDHTGSNLPTFKILLFILIFGLASFFRSYLINTTSEFAALIVKREAYSAVLYSSCGAIERSIFSDLSIRINSDSEQVAKLITDLFSFFVRNAIMSLGSISLMFAISAKLSILAFCIICFVTFFAIFFDTKIRNVIKEAEYAKLQYSSFATESIINHKIIYALSGQEMLKSYFYNLTKDYEGKLQKRIKLRSIFFASVITTMLILVTLLIWFGNFEVSKGQISSGDLASFLFYATMGIVSFGGIIELIGNLDKTFIACERILELIDEHKLDQRKLDDLSNINRKNLKEFQLEQYIDLHKIEYKYNNVGAGNSEARLVGPFNTRLYFRKCNVIIGPSGCGKTTLLNSLLGICRPCSGEFKIGNNSYSQIDRTSFATISIAYVPQEPMLFGGTLEENISFFEQDPDLEEIKRIITGLGLNDFVDSLPEGLKANIGSLGGKISGGQKQRMAIARALYRNPEILIMDEPTSQLDENNASKVLDYVIDLMKNKTIIASAHSANMINRADVIVNLEII